MTVDVQMARLRAVQADGKRCVDCGHRHQRVGLRCAECAAKAKRNREAA